MKGGQGGEKTKVVIRHLPPTLPQATLMDPIEAAFGGRYNWVSFRPGKPGQKHQSYCRAYIDFKKPDDVIEFSEFFNGHVFVNEKGTQYKAVVEYAPSQRVPKQWSKKDPREGTIQSDPEYLEFLEFISKPVENLPSAEIQLERREAEKSGLQKDAPVVTPLMDFVRQKRAAKNGSRRILSNGKPSRKAGAAGSPSSSSSSKRGSEKKKGSITMYVMRDTVRGSGRKDKSSSGVSTKRDDHNILDKAALTPGVEISDEGKGVSVSSDSGKKKVLLLKGKEKEITNQRLESSGRIIRSILLNKDTHHNQSSGAHSEHQAQITISDKDRRPPRPPCVNSKDTNGFSDDKVVTSVTDKDKQEKRPRNRDRPDRVIWTPLRRSDGTFASDESVLPSAVSLNQSGPDPSPGDVKVEISTMKSGESKVLGSGRGIYASLDNGTPKHFGRRGPTHVIKDSDGSAVESKPPKRGSSPGYEKQVWVQKSSSGS